jgi:hypothetical protein
MIPARLLAALVFLTPSVWALADEAHTKLNFPNPSSFKLDKLEHDPFSSLDDPEPEKSLPNSILVVQSGTSKTIGPELFHITTISVDKLPIAIINRRAFAPGDTFRITAADGRIIKVAVLEVRDGGVLLDLEGTKLTVPISRKEPKKE